MSRMRRFEQIEPGAPPDPAGAGRTATPGVEGRFGAAAEGPQVLDLSQGQAFVRCAACQGDSHATALVCCRCEARLDTAEQRAFNETFWKRRQEEDAELRVETERLRAAGEAADRQASEARRYLAWMDVQIALRRAGRRTPLDADFEPDMRGLGLAIGRVLRRFGLAVRRRLWRDPGR